jgi:hypothetical protein
MLYGIEVDVIGMLDQIIFISDRVFKESSLPDTSTFLTLLTLRNGPFGSTLRQPFSRESRLDRRPASREVTVAWGQFPEGVEMIGQENDCHGGKRSNRVLVPKRPSKQRPGQLVAE